MDENRKPRSRVKKVVNEGKGADIKGEGLGTGPVNNMSNYADRKDQQSHPVQNSSFGQQRPVQPQNHTSGQRPPQGGYPNHSQQRPQQSQSAADYSLNQNSRPSGSTSSFGNSGNPFSGYQQPFGGNRPSSANPIGYGSAAGTDRQYKSATKMNGTGSPRSSGTGSGMGGGKLLLIIVALMVLLGGGKIGGLFGGDSNEVSSGLLQSGTTAPQTGTVTQQTESGAMDIGNLLSAFIGSAGSTSYDLSSLLSGAVSSGGTGPFESIISSESAHQSFPSSSDNGSSMLNENVSQKARDKYTVIRGNNKDTITILVYMCGTDLESQQGMATSDLKEMANATISRDINLIIYTGGCSRWRNNVISSQTNQIYRISNGKFECLEKDAGSKSMVNPDTLVSFIEYGKKNYPADRTCLIFWDHGGGSVSGFGYDEKVGHNQSMTLAGINNALKKADIKFDFIGFDACLMATVENGLMLSQYADYMIASEETEPGVGWYYTNWLTELSKNTSMPTIQIGKKIADDFVAVCDRQCRGQGTTLSVVDLAELETTIPNELKEFSVETNELIQNKEYKKVSSARSQTREFAQQSKIDQIDLVDFANNLGTTESKSLSKALQSAVKYNRTGGGISHAYGLSIYFPYKRTNKVNQMVSTYQAIGMDEEYTRCIQEFASMEVSGQVSAGTSISGYGLNQNASSGLLGSLLGTGGGYNTSYSTDGLEELLGGIYGGNGVGSTGSILDLFMGRDMTAADAAEYIMENHFDASELVWTNGRIELSDNNWANLESVVKNVFADNGSGFIDLGCDAEFEFDGDALVDNFDGTWLSVDGNPMSYYYLSTVDYDDDQYVIYGYAPALLNDIRVNLIIEFINGEDACIAGAQFVYGDIESDTQGKMLIAIGEGDRIQFICDYYDYDGNYRDSYKLGESFTLGSSYEIANTPVRQKCMVTYCFTDFYQQKYWTPALKWEE